VFGAGYDTNKDSSGLATTDAVGRGVFIVDAVSGALVWSVTPAANSITNLQEAGLLHSVAGGITVLDSNGDQLTDRIYFADTGGQLWRVDLPGATRPDINQDTWRVVQVAEDNGGTAATDRRFFNAPDIVRTSHAGAAFDAILIGSGDRTNPNDMDNPLDPNDPAGDNQFYMFRDRAINPYFTAAPSASDCGASPPSVDFRCQLPLLPSDLYDVTANEIQSPDPAVQAAAQAALVSANGWRLDLQADGEKALARSITIAGKVYFTTFAPEVSAANVCEPTPGTGRLYVVDLLTAGAAEDFDSDGDTERSWIIGALLPDTPSPHFGEDGEIRLLLPPGASGGGSITSPYLTGASIRAPYGSYWYREEY
jgi:type IV pilus assembly protein PilY1